MTVALTLGPPGCERVVRDAARLLDYYTASIGESYLDFEPSTDLRRIRPEDLAVTILIGCRVPPQSFESCSTRGKDLDLNVLPAHGLNETTAEERVDVADLIGTMARWPGFTSSISSKVLHVKRPNLIPILDARVVFGAYLQQTWPWTRARSQRVFDLPRLTTAIDAIHDDLTRSSNQDGWRTLEQLRPHRTRLQLFEMAWTSFYLKRELRAPRRVLLVDP